MSTKFDHVEVIKAVSDPARLTIIAHLSSKKYSAAELSAEMELELDAISRHLEILKNAQLVSSITTGEEFRYQFNPKAIQQLARLKLSVPPKPNALLDVDLDDNQRKIVANYTNADGSLKAIPTKSAKVLAVLEYIILDFDPGNVYLESEVNEILSRYYSDTTTLRRLLIDYRMLNREKDGSQYWRN